MGFLMINNNKKPFSVPIGLIPTPFFERLTKLSPAKSWTNWSGYLSPNYLDTVELEYFAIRNQASIFDISPMHKYRIKGPDTLNVINRLITRDIRKIRNGRVTYAMWCDEDGMIVDDGTLFRVNDQEVLLCCQESQYSWLIDASLENDVVILDESRIIAALSLQGPTSFSILKDAGFLNVESLKPYDFTEIEPGIFLSRTGFTGDLGYEIWIKNEEALILWDRLWAAGKKWGIRAIGFEALNIARIEAGFVAVGVDFQSTHKSMRLNRGRTPIEMGYRRLVDFNKGHFNGRRELLKREKMGPRYSLVKIDIGGFKPASDSMIYHKKKREVGYVTSGVWSPTTKRNIGFAELKSPFGITKFDDLWTEIYVKTEGKWKRHMVPVSIITNPFFKSSRAIATPPGIF
jgi:aminomethyltransferase